MSADGFPQSIDFSFTAPLVKEGGPFATYLIVEGTPEYLGTGRAVKVEGTIDEVAFAATLMPSGNGPHWLPLRAAICKSIGKNSAGDLVVVHLTKRLT